MSPVDVLLRRGVAIGCACWMLLLFGGPPSARAQVSPGKLAKVHTELEGSQNCKVCHSGGREAMDTNCIGCHGEISALQRANRGLHGNVAGQTCASCHPDHAGVEFDLIYWEEGSPEQFNHERTGWSLSGGHVKVNCNDCHQPKFQTASISGTWLGLRTECKGCHQDVHEGSLDANCTLCHGDVAWAPASNFDHASSAFPLTGKHSDALCETCHQNKTAVPSPGTSITLTPQVRIFKPLDHAECSSCHKDAHAGRFGLTCSGCHQTGGFNIISEQGFDHNLTRYPLLGRHDAVACASCHSPDAPDGSLPVFAECASCHQDPHDGQATIGGKLVDCTGCHTETGFSPATFSIEEHKATSFALQGKHVQVACLNCHQGTSPDSVSSVWGSANVNFHPSANTCQDCHTDAHGAQLASSDSQGACDVCHSVDSFKPSTFTSEAHTLAGMKLDARHGEIACSDCHGPVRPGLPDVPGLDTVGSAGVWLSLGNGDCDSCHLDAHDGRFTDAAKGDESQDCSLCHSLDGFNPSSIDEKVHAEFSFPLDGAHAAVPCAFCHQELERETSTASLLLTGSVTPLLFSKNRTECVECHTNPHGNQFETSVSQGVCNACHGTELFQPATKFDHNRDATFSLEGAHGLVPCVSCHPAASDAIGLEGVLFRPLDSTCESCHKDGTPEPGSGAGGF